MKESVLYEQTKFKELMEKNPDCLKLTTIWLSNSIEKLKTNNENLSKTNILSHAYIHILEEAKPGWHCPESLLLDEIRIIDISKEVYKLTILCTVLVVVSTYLGKHLPTDSI